MRELICRKNKSIIFKTRKYICAPKFAAHSLLSKWSPNHFVITNRNGNWICTQKLHVQNVYKYRSPWSETSARNYRPCFRENQPKRSFSIKWKRAFWACFRENWVYKFGQRYRTFATILTPLRFHFLLPLSPWYRSGPYQNIMDPQHSYTELHKFRLRPTLTPRGDWEGLLWGWTIGQRGERWDGAWTK